MPENSAGGDRRGMHVQELSRDGMKELFLTLEGGEVGCLGTIADEFHSRHAATVLGAECFSPLLNGNAEAAAKAQVECTAMPLTWVLGSKAAIGGVHVRAVAGAEARPLVLDGRLIGTVVDGPYAVEVMLAGLYAENTSAPRSVQARATFERMEEALALADMDFSHVVRTWLFLDDILDWYGDFNEVRTDFFTERGVFDRYVPASTGIGGSNPAGAAMTTGVYAVKPKLPEVRVEAVPSPLQCPALQYGSSFSRAAEVSMPDMRRLFVSGTASIAPGGETVHVGDVLAQTQRTCEVVEAILQSRGMGWENVTRATAYVRFPEDAGVFKEFRAKAGMPELPVVVAHNVICRGDLLFEIEVDAAVAQS